MTPEEDKILGALSECPLAPLEGVPTYNYMIRARQHFFVC